VELIEACIGNPIAFGKVNLPSDGFDVSTPELIHTIARAAQLSEERQGSNCREQTRGNSTHLVAFPECLLKAGARLPGLGSLHKLTASLFVDEAALACDLIWTPRFTMQEGLLHTFHDA